MKIVKSFIVFQDKLMRVTADIRADGQVFISTRPHIQKMKLSEYKFYLLLLSEIKQKLRALGHKKVYIFVEEYNIKVGHMFGFLEETMYEDMAHKKWVTMVQDT